MAVYPEVYIVNELCTKMCPYIKWVGGHWPSRKVAQFSGQVSWAHMQMWHSASNMSEEFRLFATICISITYTCLETGKYSGGLGLSSVCSTAAKWFFVCIETLFLACDHQLQKSTWLDAYHQAWTETPQIQLSSTDLFHKSCTYINMWVCVCLCVRVANLNGMASYRILLRSTTPR